MDKPSWTKIDKEFVVEPQISGQAQVQLIARAKGWQIGGESGTPFAAAFVRLRPVSAVVQREDGEETIELVDPTIATIRAMVGSAMLISVACWIVMRIAQGVIGWKKK